MPVAGQKAQAVMLMSPSSSLLLAARCWTMTLLWANLTLKQRQLRSRCGTTTPCSNLDSFLLAAAEGVLALAEI